VFSLGIKVPWQPERQAPEPGLRYSLDSDRTPQASFQLLTASHGNYLHKVAFGNRQIPASANLALRRQPYEVSIRRYPANPSHRNRRPGRCSHEGVTKYEGRLLPRRRLGTLPQLGGVTADGSGHWGPKTLDMQLIL
jgi:hypothetical protein